MEMNVRGKKSKKTTGGYFVCMFFFLIVMAFGIFISSAVKKGNENCTEKVDARVVDMNISYSTSSKKGRTEVYAPVYEFVFDSQKHRVASDVYSNVNAVDTGDEVLLYVDPDNVENIYCPEQNKNVEKIADIVKLIGGGLAALFAILGIISFIRKILFGNN